MTTSRVRENAVPGDSVAPPSCPLGLRLAGAGVHLYTALGSVLGFWIVIAAFEGNAITALWLGLATLWIDGTDGCGPALPGQGDDPLVRRRPDGRHRRLPHVRLRPDRPALDDQPPTGRPDRLGGRRAAAARVLLPVLPGRREDRRPLLPRLPELLERRRFLRDRPGHRPAWRGRSRSSSSPSWCSCRCATSTRRAPAAAHLDLALAGVWLVTYAVLLAQYPDPNPIVVALSLAYLVYYIGLSLYLTVGGRLRSRQAVEPRG